METRTESYKALWEAIWHLEREIDLFDRRIGDTYYWPILRGTVVRRLAARFGFHAPLTAKIWTLRFKRGSAACAAIATNRDLLWGSVAVGDSILIPFGRKQMREGRVVDVFSDRILHEADLGRFVVLDNSSHLGRYDEAPARSVRDWDSVRLASRIRAMSSFPALLAPAKAEYRKLNEALKRELGTPFPLSVANLAFRCAAFDEGRSLSRDIFSCSGARRLFIAGRHSAPEALAAANDLAMTTVELQHGVITRYDPDFHYPGRPQVPYAPDRLLTFSRYWTEDIDLPRQTRAVVIGSANISPDLARSEPKVARRVVFVSQWAVGSKLIEVAAAMAAAAPEWEFVFRPHPLGDVRRHKAYLARHAGSLRNLSISNPHGDLYRLLASADVQIGVYSTSLYEGMVLGLRTIVLALPGAEHLTRVIEEGDAAFARNAAEAAALLPTAPASRDPGKYYAAPVPSIAAAMAAN